MMHMEEGTKEVGVGEDEMMMGHGIMHQCIDHPHRNNNNNTGGGICAFCLQDKLGKLLSSSFPLNSSPSDSFRSNNTTPPTVLPPNKNNTCDDHHNHTRSRLPFLMPKNKKKTKASTNSSLPSSSSSASDIIFKRSKSTATTREDDMVVNEDSSPRKRNRFWSFLYLSSKFSHSSSAKKMDAKSNKRDSNGTPSRISSASTSAASGSLSSVVKHREEKSNAIGSHDNSPYYNSQTNVAYSGSCFDHHHHSKVSRSRSVGCGSRSFSGDFFDRVSTGLGDCSTLRRIESQRDQCMVKGRVSCGGIFGGFMMMNNASSNNSNSSSSSYWGSWAFASPVRAFSSKAASSKDNKNNGDKSNNATPNLSAIPSLLAVTG